MRKQYIYLIVLTLMSLLASCTQEEEWGMAAGKLRLSIGQVSVHTESRATPSELGKPLAENFNIKVQRQGSDYVGYEGRFTEEIEVKVGTYDITATYGENILIGRDAPYYIGTAEATVTKDASTSVSIPCKVGNALVSVIFGRNEEEHNRFSRFYEEYGLLVKVDNYSMPITHDKPGSSIYFAAGSRPEFVFYGTLKNDGGRMVSIQLTHKDLPDVFQAADHAKLTLTLPDPESALGVNISKAEVTTVQLDETIPLSWLPVSTVVPTHQYNEENMLVGTNLTFSNNYPGMEWKAVVTNANGETVRTTTGTGALFSEYKSSPDWPYLPAGKYKATYYLVKENGDNKVSSREFMVGSPTLTTNVFGYTSYNKYMEGDINAANHADGYTLYEPQVNVNVASSLTANTRYGFKMTYIFDGNTQTTKNNTQNIGQKVLDARLAAYNLSVKVDFAGEQASANKDFYITGVPFLFEPPTTSTWEISGDVTDEDEYARMGRWHGGSQSMTYNKVAIPAGTYLNLNYKFIPNAGAVSTTCSIEANGQTMVSGKAGSYEQPTYEGIQPVVLQSSTTFIRCNNSYGAGNTGTDVYRIGLEYRK